MSSSSAMPWVKAYTEMLDDTKLLRLNDACCWRFMQLILLAGVCDANGLLTTGTAPMSLDDIAVRLRTRPSRLAPQMASLINLGLIENTPDGYRVTKFAERQGRPQHERRDKWNASAAKSRQSAAESGPDWSQIDANLAPKKHEPAQEVPEIATIPQKSSLNHRPRVEKSREENTMAGDKPARRPPWSEEVDRLMQVFSLAANVKQPFLKSKSDFAEAQAKWVKPLQEIERNCNGNAATIITKAVAQMRAGKYTCAFPKQIVTVALSLNAEQAGYASAPSPTPAL